MLYDVLTLKSPEDLLTCPPFSVDQFNWGGDYRPVTTGRLGFLPGNGFLLRMECSESSPCRIYTRDNEPVYLDSAMEAFFCFAPEALPPCYLNFEINANGAMLSGYGAHRQKRALFSDADREELCCQAEIFKDFWRITLLLPLSLLTIVYPGLSLHSGSRFTCNFYKIKESQNLTHFASFAPIPTREPNFHLPEYFAKAQIVG